MELKFRFLKTAIILCVLLSSSLFAFDDRADESLAKGKRLYADGRYEEAMDQFIDVFVSGNTDQIAEANEYVNLIHFDRGGVVAPKQVPYDETISNRQKYWTRDNKYGTNSNNEKAKTGNGDVGPLKEIYVRETEEDIPEPPTSVPEANPFGYSENSGVLPETKGEEVIVSSEAESVTSNSKEVPVVSAKAEDISLDSTKNSGNEVIIEQSNSADYTPEVEVLSGEVEITPGETQISEDQEYILLDGKANIKRGKNIISDETSFPWGSKSRVHSLEKKAEKQQRQELIDYLVAKLNADEDVQVYMRGGRVDAVDINSSALFLGRNIDKVSSPILDDVYALMILENSPAYVILPEGSYTDDVTLHGVRQAVALNTYLINRGISPSKMTLNMGLTTQEPPEKFSDLAGVSIVFDYAGKSRLKSKLKEKDMPPVLSLAVYPFKEIVPSAGEVFVIDFSVMQATSPIKEWVLQIVSHAADKHYYVVKQFSGDSPLNYQAFWNGHKRYFGHILPLGKYTIVLRAKDTAGRERILKRQVILKEGPTNEESIIMKTESEVVKEEEFKRIKEEQEAKQRELLAKEKERESKLDYSQKRLWNKPNKKKVGTSLEEEEETHTTSTSVVSTKVTEEVYQSSETKSSTNTSQEQSTTEETTSYGATANPYDIEDSGEYVGSEEI